GIPYRPSFPPSLFPFHNPIANPKRPGSLPLLPSPTPRSGCPRLFNLIQMKDPKLRVAFYYACRDTLVAADLNQASRIGYMGDRRFGRVITLQRRCLLVLEELESEMAACGENIRVTKKETTAAIVTGYA
ncbi:hypothetical protein Agub_g14317, partial [Astrephomene gubernaculifera]